MYNTVKFKAGVGKYLSEFYMFGPWSNLWYIFDGHLSVIR